MKISFAEMKDYHHHLGYVKVRLKAVAKTRISLTDTKAGDKRSTFKIIWN